MTRNEAIELLVRQIVRDLSPDAREAILIGWWSIDAEDSDYDCLPPSLKAVLAQAQEPSNPASDLYEPLLCVALRREYRGVLNSYLERQLRSLGHAVVVEGDVEVLVACPCCGYLSLGDDGGYQVCPVCFWENDGVRDLEGVSPANCLTLREARRNFSRFGAVSEAFRRHVLPDGEQRYARVESAMMFGFI